MAGDTPCTTTLPVMCAVADVPKPTWWTSQWPAWSGKKLRASYAVPGTSLTSRAAADRVCKSRFGENARMAEAHENGTDGSGYLGQGNPMTMWVSIDDQRANPWNTTTGRALTWAVAANDGEMQQHLPSCLASLNWCDDVIVVDSFSTDDTEAICRASGARFVQHAFEGFGAQRNWAIDNCAPKYPWILILDADERVPVGNGN
ncbi:MAG: glycosyltransferase family 2 protein [Candidatus Nanopelagicales bacterium]